MPAPAFPRTALFCLLASACFAALLLPGLRDQDASNLPLYQGIARQAETLRAGEPDAALESEYPPLASALFSVARTLPLPYPQAWLLLELAAIAACVALTSRRADPDRAWMLPAGLAVSAALLGRDLFLNRYDLFVFLGLYAAWMLRRDGRHAAAGAMLGIAVGLKAVPVLLLPLLLLDAPRGKRLRVAAGFAAALVLGLALAAVVLTPAGAWGNILYLLRYHAVRGAQLESLWSGLALLLGALRGVSSRVIYESGAFENADVPGGIVSAASVLALAGAAGATWLGARRGRGTDLTPAFALILLWPIAVGPVLSPQYLVWVAPLLWTWLLERFRREGDLRRADAALALLLTLACVATQWLYPLYYEELQEDQALREILVLTLRNGALLGSCGVLAWRAARAAEEAGA